MFNIGGLEMLIIFLVALLVFGPDRLPEIMRNVGKAVRTFQNESRKAQDLLRAGLEDPVKTPKAGVVDKPDGYVEPGPAEPPAPAPPTPRPSSDHEVRPVVRELEDT